MTKTDELNILFAKWQNNTKYNIFCEDGIVDEDTYNDTELKVLFVLKDVNNQKGDTKVDMRKSVIEDCSQGRTWKPVAQWAVALIDGISYSQDIKCYEELKKIAFMNLKKEAGGPRVSDKCILYCSNKDKKELFREVKICEPDVIIACSSIVFEALCESVFNNNVCVLKHELDFNEQMKKYDKYCDVGSLLGLKKTVYLFEYRHPNQCGKNGTCEEHYNNMLKIREYILNR